MRSNCLQGLWSEQSKTFQGGKFESKEVKKSPKQVFSRYILINLCYSFILSMEPAYAGYALFARIEA